MGEMADYALDQVATYEEAAMDYRAGKMSMETAIMNGVVDEQGYEYSAFSTTVSSRTCRCCNQDGLYWKKSDGKWLLHEKGSIHNCSVNKLSPNNNKQ